MCAGFSGPTAHVRGWSTQHPTVRRWLKSGLRSGNWTGRTYLDGCNASTSWPQVYGLITLMNFSWRNLPGFWVWARRMLSY